MSDRVNLLLLLSALLSALTGASSAERAPQQAVAVSRVAETTVRASVAAGRSVRPEAGLPSRAAVQVMTRAAWALAPAAPLYLSRRRE